MTPFDRRRFLKTSVVSIASLSALSYSRAADAPNDKVVLAMIGIGSTVPGSVGGRGRQLIRPFSSFKDVDIAYLCDIDERFFPIGQKLLAAGQRREAGKSRFEAALAACQLRLRPIIMTSFAFIFGVLPLMISVGAGAEMRRTLGTAVFAGMLGVTLFGIFLTPVFYYVIQWVKDRGAAVEMAGVPLTLREGEVREGEAPAEPLLLVAEPAEPQTVDVYDNPAHTPDFDALRESFQRSKIIIRVEPKREGSR